ncbi:MAG TPA: DUF1844 domain-containing protein [Candidatus Angelobacter sp.]|nr:DUF1844 domain-containing protein [Candidatus Angelobacter sp.]
MAEKKQEDFVVSDRRRFVEGELRSDLPASEEENETPTAPPVQPAASVAETPKASEPPTKAPAAEQEMPEPPTAAEQQEQHDAYRASGKKLEEMIGQSGARRQNLPEMTFERLVEQFYMTALIQLGAIRHENEPPAVDMVGARQTIDSIAILQEKTKGNLGDREQRLLQNVLFELRMAWIEITNALAGAAAAKSNVGPAPDKK